MMYKFLITMPQKRTMRKRSRKKAKMSVADSFVFTTSPVKRGYLCFFLILLQTFCSIIVKPQDRKGRKAMPTLAPSILSADFANLERDIKEAESAGADLLHVDVMDGRFVPNITVGIPVVESIRKVTELPIDVHLMIVEPEKYIPDFIKAGADWVSFHYEAATHHHRIVTMIKELGAKAGIVLNPSSPVHLLEEILPYLDFVLVMSVNPGFGGQKFIGSSVRKIEKLKMMIDEM